MSDKRSRGATTKCFRLAIVSGLLLSCFGMAHAADPYDGEWIGSATPVTRKGQCGSGVVTLDVIGRDATGLALFDGEPRNIIGTVLANGAFGGTIGFMHLKGRFAEDDFTGTFSSPDCAWSVDLTRNKQGAREVATMARAAATRGGRPAFMRYAPVRLVAATVARM